jgi:hypothetical protein
LKRKVLSRILIGEMVFSTEITHVLEEFYVYNPTPPPPFSQEFTSERDCLTRESRLNSKHGSFLCLGQSRKKANVII